MFNFLKKFLFEQEEVFSSEEVSLEDLDPWLDSKLAQIEFKEEIILFLNQLKDKKWVLGEKLDTLATAQMEAKDQEKVDEKIKNVVLGHKESYLREMKRFLDSLEIPYEPSIYQALTFNSSLNQALDQVSQKTAKSYQAAQHLFFNPVEEVFKEVSEINLLTKEFTQKLSEKNFHKINEIKEKIQLLKEERKRKQRLEEDMHLKEEKLQRCLTGKEKQETEIQRLTSSPDFEEFKALKEKEEKAKKQVEENQDEVFQLFSKLGRALRKYEKITLETKIVKAYLEDAVKAFFNDPDLKILGVLEGLRKSLEKGEFELDEKQKENALELIKQAQGGYLKEILAQSIGIKERFNEVKAKLRRYTIDHMIEEAEYKLEHFSDQTILTQREIEELKVKLNSFDNEKLREDLNGVVKEVLKTEVKVV